MILLGVLLALALERSLGDRPWLAEPQILRRSLALLRRVLTWERFWAAAPMPLLLVTPWVALAIWAQWAIPHPLLDLLFATVLLFLALGPRDLADDIERLLAARASGDTEAAAQVTAGLMRGPEPEATRHELIGALFIQSHERLFGVLLWFFAFGTFGAAGAGALAYRLVSRLPRLLAEQGVPASGCDAAARLHTLMAWAPARITAALYGLAGSMDDAMREWRRLRESPDEGWRSRTWSLLAEVPAGSLSIEEAHSGPAAPASLDECLREVRALQNRTLLILLALFAVFTIGELV